MKELIDLAKELGCNYFVDEPMSEHTTFKIGGKAAFMVFVNSQNDIACFVKKCRHYGIRYIAVGNGSNLLVSDEGIDACVIVMGKEYSEVKLLDNDMIYAQSGASLMKVCRFALGNELTGLEFAYGIPGSCGGGAFMNAGAYGGEMKDVMIKCDHIDSNGDLGFLEGNNLDLSYRHSAYYSNNCIISGIYLKLKKGKKEEIKARMDELLQRRRDKQPLEFPSAGSTFKRPEGYFAGALIQECGLKGMTVGGAKVSEKHSGFVINTGGASCSDVLKLCRKVSETVLKQKGVKLEMEIRVTK